MERRVRGNSHARCGVGENLEKNVCGFAAYIDQKITYHYSALPT